MMTFSKWLMALVLMIAGTGLTSVQAQYYSSIDASTVIPVGKIGVSIINNSVYTAQNGNVKTISRAYGARFGVGIFNNFDVSLQADFLDLPNHNGIAMTLTPKYAVGNTGLAVSMPLMAIDSEDSDENFGFSPTLLFSKLITKKGIEIGLSASRTEFVNSSHGWYTFSLSPAYKKENYSIRPEYGYSITDGQLPNAFHYGVGVTYIFP